MDMKKKEIHQLLSQFINGECSPLYWVFIKKYFKKMQLESIVFLSSLWILFTGNISSLGNPPQREYSKIISFYSINFSAYIRYIECRSFSWS
jgi:hypothetical protein